MSSQYQEREALGWLLDWISSWTCARWDQHLRDRYGDEQAEPIIAWIKSLLAREQQAGQPCPECGEPLRVECSSCSHVQRAAPPPPEEPAGEPWALLKEAKEAVRELIHAREHSGFVIGSTTDLYRRIDAALAAKEKR